MTSLRIIHAPNPVLRKRCKKVPGISPMVIALSKDMTDTLVKYKNPHEIGAALAAPQIGELVQLTVVRKDFEADVSKIKNPAKNFFTLVNPEVIEKSDEQAEDLEGCLSIPGLYGQVKRPKRITVKALDLNGKGLTIHAKDFMARVLQHEIDHLHGILFTDRVADFKELYRMNKEGQLIPENLEHREKAY